MTALEQIYNQRILYGALNWGMGHISRSIDLLRQLERQNNQLVIGCHSEQEQILRGYFPNAAYVTLDGYPISFSQNGFNSMKFFLQLPKLQKHLLREKKMVREFVKRASIDLILSDHRYVSGMRKFPAFSLRINANCLCRGMESFYRQFMPFI
jgi:UDP:flavonoid glycosyltransferase YjiC (YdhE family)